MEGGQVHLRKSAGYGLISVNQIIHFFSVKEAAESLNTLLMELIEELDDTPTPASGTPSQESQSGEITSDNKEIIVSQKGEVTSSNGEEADIDSEDM